MTTSAAKKIFDEALALDQEDREELVGLLSGSLEPIDVSDAWREELAARAMKIERGEAELDDAREHLEKLRTKHGA